MAHTDVLDLPLVLLSNRGPVSFDRDATGRTVNRGAGGLVSALAGLAEHLDDAVWVCGAATAEDAAVAEEAAGQALLVQTHPMPHLVDPRFGDAVVDGPSIKVRVVVTDPVAYADFYSVWSNPILWFVQHGLYGRSMAPSFTRAEREAFENGYAAVNRAYADAVADEVRGRGGKALVLLQDYHFYLVAEHVRRQCPDVVLSHFVHIPWPGPDEWRVLPADIRERLLTGLLGSDVVGFHTRRYARNFVLCASELLGLPIDLDALTITVGDRTVRARYYPISVDPAALDATLASEQVTAHVSMLRYIFGLDDDRQLMLRVDRTDPSKNVVRGFQAFGVLLEQHPELVGKVSFLALLQPSRTDVPEYADYIALIGAVVADLNAKYTKDGRQPIDLRMVEDFPLAVAAFSICDVLVVNAIADGMNLVAKEVAVVNRRGGVLALSETAGAHEELGEFAVTLHPFDIQQMADAFYAALTMPLEERHRRLAAAAQQVRANDVARWLADQLADLRRVAGF
ncbi:trehalose-6-phosphate synthase [Frankia sp. CNm7]|uniref:Trehalose-6-phosphate synthase n=1 Tax=Frankia nepalensis TaxID=1836974 RepID=A0A937ULT0_9ACTN|nr:trehalose-6-phosphate synthase [Frankia nepalensis]MBL7501673.1 trehalose-6-phosphate synthase [Frankia nepalensis]MBL7513397.1 trehalose-6-phosphate synthase [Frankia nepalensis]MBL7522445.1 trehalose-6-phosphate synthase [Frankia nepalensis]MBL7626353.1 trehalose-6-phosphate synthase [Frankia nepalensis]